MGRLRRLGTGFNTVVSTDVWTAQRGPPVVTGPTLSDEIRSGPGSRDDGTLSGNPQGRKTVRTPDRSQDVNVGGLDGGMWGDDGGTLGCRSHWGTVVVLVQGLRWTSQSQIVH